MLLGCRNTLNPSWRPQRYIALPMMSLKIRLPVAASQAGPSVNLKPSAIAHGRVGGDQRQKLLVMNIQFDDS
jgi:hypothetical protein